MKEKDFDPSTDSTRSSAEAHSKSSLQASSGSNLSNNRKFEQLVNTAMAELPRTVLEKMENVAIVIEKKPASERLGKGGIRSGSFLLGLYQGVPKNVWGRGFGNILPDKITIFQEPIEQLARHNEGKVLEILRNTVLHEILHHFGFDEKEVRVLERKRKQKR